MTERAAAPGLRRLAPYWHEYTTRAKTRWYGRQILEVFTTEFRDRTKEYYTWAIYNGLCTVNGHRVTPTYRIQNSDLIVNRVHRHEPAVTDTPVKILYRDDARGRIVVVKPGSIPVHSTGRFHKQTLVEMVKAQTGVENVLPSNRLDRLTSGVMVCSTTRQAAADLGNEFNAGLVNKVYVCRVCGRFPEQEVDCTEPILAVDRQSGLNIVHPSGKECRTLFQRLSYDPASDTSVLVCRPITGRTHQIRVHTQWLGHPITNDPLYNHPVWASVDRNVLATAKPRHYERVGGETGNVEVERVLAALKGSRDDQEGWARWRDDVLFGTLNRQLGYEQVYVPGPNGAPAEPPPEGSAPASLDANVCDVCRVPLLADPAPEELYIYLHAIKYWTDTWVYEDSLPWWACEDWQAPAESEPRYLPPLPLCTHYAGSGSEADLGKGGARRRATEPLRPRLRLVQRPMHRVEAPRPVATAQRDLVLDVPRGLEDAVQSDVLQRVAAAPADGPAVRSALHSGVLILREPFATAALAMYAGGELPGASAAYFKVAEQVMPRALLDELFQDRVRFLSAGGRSGDPMPSEHAFLEWLDALWARTQGALHQALAAWAASGGRGRPHSVCLLVDRNSYVFPTLSATALEAHLHTRLLDSLNATGGAWEVAPRTEAALLVKVTLAPRLGVEEVLEYGPRARQGNPSGSLLLQVHVPAGEARTPAAVRAAMGRARAHAVCCMLPLPEEGAAEPPTVGAWDTDPEEPLRAALLAALAAHGVRATCAAADRDAPLDALVAELPERARDRPHAELYDVYYAYLERVYHALRTGARALVITQEPKTLMRAVRELENHGRRTHSATALALEPLVWAPAPETREAHALAALEDAQTHRDGDAEAQMRGGIRAFFYNRAFLATLVQRPLFR